MIQLAPQLPMSQQGTYQEHTLGINTVPRPVAGRFNAPHRHLPARPGDLSRHHAARDPPAGPGDDGERAEISPKGMGQSQGYGPVSRAPVFRYTGTMAKRNGMVAPPVSNGARPPSREGRARPVHTSAREHQADFFLFLSSTSSNSASTTLSSFAPPARGPASPPGGGVWAEACSALYIASPIFIAA